MIPDLQIPTGPPPTLPPSRTVVTLESELLRRRRSLPPPPTPPAPPPVLPAPPPGLGLVRTSSAVVGEDDEDDDANVSGETEPVPPLPLPSELPEWFRESDGTYADETRRIVYPPGSVRNPLTFRGETFTDILFILGSVHMHFIRCTFVRSGFEGNSEYCKNDSANYKGAVSEATARRVEIMGTKANPLVLPGRTFAHSLVDFADVHAILIKCQFVKCTLRGFRHARMVDVDHVDETVPYDTARLGFYVVAKRGTEVVRIFGTLACEPAPTRPVSLRTSLSSRVMTKVGSWRASFKDAMAKEWASGHSSASTATVVRAPEVGE